ncbi:MAG TPA: PAS domain S-box protein, partial [Acidimicrobiales bacterium]|nr:PAS domain S-box protein [Acidimicrobiales bacterium]
MDRAERSTSVQGSPFSLFQTTIMLEEHVRRRTAELEAALRDNEKVNRALRISEARFRGVVSQSLVGIVTTTDGRITYSNTKFDEMFGYTDGELKGVDPIELVTDRDRGLVADSIRSRASGETNHVDYTFQGLRRDGDIIEVECHGSAVDVGGQLLLISVMRDITERTRAEREVEALQGRLWEQST